MKTNWNSPSINLSLLQLTSPTYAELIPISLNLSVWSIIRAFNGQTTNAIDVPDCNPLKLSNSNGRQPYMILLPYPVGNATKVSLLLIKCRIASFCISLSANPSFEAIIWTNSYRATPAIALSTRAIDLRGSSMEIYILCPRKSKH